MRGADGHEQAGGLKTEGSAREAGGGYAGNLLGLVQSAGFRDGQRDRMAVDEGDGGRLAVRRLDGEAQAEAGPGQSEFMLADFVEQASSVAQNDGDAGDR